MKIGVIVPQEEIGSDVGALRAFIQAAEEIGYDHLVAFDSVLTENPGYEPLVLFGLYAGLTQRIGLLTGVVVATSRQTLLLAKQAATVDVLSGGRLRLGISAGWNQDEFAAMGADFQDRGAHLDEQMAVLHALWTTPTVTFEGRWHTLHDAQMPPLPVQRPIPLWLGGQADAVLRRVGRLGDGWIPVDVDPTDPATYDQLQQQIARIYEYAAEAGRPHTAVGIEAQGGVELERGGEANWALRAERWRSLGATHLSVNTMGVGLSTVDAHIEMLRRVKSVLVN